MYVYKHTYIQKERAGAKTNKMLKLVNPDEGVMGVVSNISCNSKFEIISK